MRYALEHISILKLHLERGTLEDLVITDAVNMRLSAAIESLSHTTPEFRESHFGEDWKLMRATRNRISHGYSFVDQSLIELTIMNRLPVLEQRLRSALEQF